MLAASFRYMQLGILELNTIYTGDARELSLQIPDKSIDLIFTDPVYDRIEDYIWLAQTAKRVLKPKGAILVWSNGKWHHENARWLEVAGLKYRWDFGCIRRGGKDPLYGKIIGATNRLLWLDLKQDSLMRDYLQDGYSSISNPSAKLHRWAKSPQFTAQAVKAFADEDAVIFDPFTGGGTVPAICKMLNRNFLAFEIEPETAEQARLRLAQTMPLLEQQLQEELFKAEDAAA